MRINIILLSVLLGAILTSCEDELDERPTDEMLRFEAYMRVHYPNLEPKESGLYFLNLSGNMDSQVSPDSGNYILYDYSIQNLDGKVVETTNRQTAWLHDILSNTTNYAPSFRMYSPPQRPLVKGIAEGIGYMNEGDSVRLFMPSSLAYGNRTYKGLPPYTSIIVDIVLHRVLSLIHISEPTRPY